MLILLLGLLVLGVYLNMLFYELRVIKVKDKIRIFTDEDYLLMFRRKRRNK
jgi:predicted proteasome-type protease